MNFTIRPATSADTAAMQRIEIDAGRRFAEVGMHTIAADDPPSVEQLAAHIADGTAWVATEVGLDIGVGYVIASVVDAEGHIDQVSVSVDAQGRGLGKALLNAVESWAQARGLPSVTLTTFLDVEWNAPYYERRGFVRIEGNRLGPELAAIRHAEITIGLDAMGERVAMRKPLIPAT